MSGEEQGAAEVAPSPPIVDCTVRKLSGSTVQYHRCRVAISNDMLVISDGEWETTYIIRNIEGWDTRLSD